MRKHYIAKTEETYLNVSYKVFKKEEVLFEVFDGHVNINNLKSFHEYLVHDKSIDDNLQIISDLSDVEIRMKFYEVPLFVEYFNSFHGGRNRKIAIVLDCYNYQVFSTILAANFQKIDVDLRLFKSVAPALNWIGKNNLKNEIQHIRAEAKNEHKLVS